MTVQDALAELLGVKVKDIPSLASTPDGHKMTIDGVDLGYRQEMPQTRGGLLRFGRHIYMIDWFGDEKSAKQLTKPGT